MIWVAFGLLALVTLPAIVLLWAQQVQLASLGLVSAQAHARLVELFLQEMSRMQQEINEGNDLSASQTERILEMRNYLLWQANRDQFTKYEEPKPVAESDRN